MGRQHGQFPVWQVWGEAALVGEGGATHDALVARLVHHLAQLDGHPLGDTLQLLGDVRVVVEDDLHLSEVLRFDILVVHPHLARTGAQVGERGGEGVMVRAESEG
eukprot:2684410-Prymnesium_polylepis.1